MVTLTALALSALCWLNPAFAQTADTAPAHVVASLVLKVPQRDQATDALIAEAQRLGGWFAGLSDNGVSLRVPREQADVMISFALAQGLVVERSFNSEDLSARLTESRARLTAREAALKRYMDLLPTASAGAVVSVEREINGLIAQIESLKGQIRVLEHHAAWAELNVSFQFRERNAPSRGGSSSFGWINTLNLTDLIEVFRLGIWDRQGPSVGLGPIAPEGFSPYKPRHERRAVSPDEVVLRARAVKHKPEADLAFWREATRERMVSVGYAVLREEDITMNGTPGFLLELTAPYGAEDYLYAVAVFPQGKKLIIVEVAGEVTAYEARRAAVLQAITEGGV